MQVPYSYAETLAVSERVNWRVEDIIGGDRRLDFGRPFLPEALVWAHPMDFLDASERRTLNQIRGHSYLAIFGLVEEFILPFVLDHARGRLDVEDYEIRALLQFATEEAKHIHLFRTFMSEFRRDFGHDCAVIGPPSAVAEAVLAHGQLGVALAILHIEWMTQRHYVESAKHDSSIDPQFESLLRHHWMEEAQHAKLDTLIVHEIAARSTPREVQNGIAQYEDIVRFLEDGLGQQVGLDLEAFQRAIGRELGPAERRSFIDGQRESYRATFIDSGRTHPKFVRTLKALDRM